MQVYVCNVAEKSMFLPGRRPQSTQNSGHGEKPLVAATVNSFFGTNGRAGGCSMAADSGDSVGSRGMHKATISKGPKTRKFPWLSIQDQHGLEPKEERASYTLHYDPADEDAHREEVEEHGAVFTPHEDNERKKPARNSQGEKPLVAPIMNFTRPQTATGSPTSKRPFVGNERPLVAPKMTFERATPAVDDLDL